MILLSDSTIRNHPVMSELKVPPTHAKLIFRRVALVPSGSNLPSTLNAVLGDEEIQVVYAYGKLVDGNFVPSTMVEGVHSMVDIGDYSTVPIPDDESGNKLRQKIAASQNLRAAGARPDPNQPFVAISVPNAKADDFKVCDLDAYFAFADDRLGGTCVAD